MRRATRKNVPALFCTYLRRLYYAAYQDNVIGHGPRFCDIHVTDTNVYAVKCI